MEVRELTCIGCPLGCQLTVTMGNDEIKVEGNTCPRGEAYAKKEVTNPTRIVTSTVRGRHDRESSGQDGFGYPEGQNL